MPPQPGMFALPYSSTHKSRASNQDHDGPIAYHHAPPPSHHNHHAAGPSRAHGSVDDGKRDKKRKESSGKLAKETNERRDDGRHFAESIPALHATAHQLSTRPSDNPLYNLRLYSISLERSALLAQLELEERHALHCATLAYDEECDRVEDEWKKGRERVRERLLEGIEERRRKAREEKEGEGTVGDAALDAQSRSHITRKLRNKLGNSPPDTPLGPPSAGGTTGVGLPLAAPMALVNPHSLSIDEIPSPFPLALTSDAAPAAATGTAPNGGRRKAKGGGFHASQGGFGNLGKSIAMITPAKDLEIEHDMNEIRRGNKRRRVAVQSLMRVTA